MVCFCACAISLSLFFVNSGVNMQAKYRTRINAAMHTKIEPIKLINEL